MLHALIRKVRSGVARLAGSGPAAAGRALRPPTVFADDTYIVSYPKSGNTWTRFLIGNLNSPEEPVTFANVEAKVPDIYQSSDAVLKAAPRPRLLKSHESFDPRYPRVIYIVRDPRDVAVSYFHHNVKLRAIGDDAPIAPFVDAFLRGEGLPPFGTWRENVDGWLAERDGSDGFLLLRYEDMLADPAASLVRIARFLGIDAGPDRVAEAVARSSADAMRKLEREQGASWKPMAGTREDKAFVRSAKQGGWRDELPPEAVAAIESQWAATMERLGYARATAGR